VKHRDKTEGAAEQRMEPTGSPAKRARRLDRGSSAATLGDPKGADVRVGTRSALLGLVVIGVLGLVSCQLGTGQPDRVVKRFYDAAIREDTVAAEKLLASQHEGLAREIIRTATREGTLNGVELVSTNVWAEHGAVCEVRKSFSDGATDIVRIDVTREAGDWKVASGTPSF